MYIFLLSIFLLLFTSKDAESFIFLSDTSISDTSLTYPFPSNQFGGLYMNFPENFNKQIVFDKNTDKYILIQLIEFYLYNLLYKLGLGIIIFHIK